jgi:hypothetical protein
VDSRLWTWSTGPPWTDPRGTPPFRSGPSVPIGRPWLHAGDGRWRPSGPWWRPVTRVGEARRSRAKWGSRAPFLTASAWRGRGGGGETHRRLGRKGGRKRRSTRRLRRRAVLRRPFGAAVLRGWVGAEERCERCKRWCRTYIG